MRGVALAGLTVAALVAACGSTGSYTTVVGKIRNAGRVVVGTKWDQPSLGLKTGEGPPEGFDADVAKYIVDHIAKGRQVQITWRESASSTREALLQNGSVDLIVATYSIAPSRRPMVTFGGPYIVTPQDTMVRASDTSIKKVTDLRGKRLCLAEGSNSYRRIVDPPPNGNLNLPMQLVPAANYSDCVRKLADGRLDAISTLDLILAGFAEQEPGRFRLLNDPVSTEGWGVGIKKGDTATCEAVNQAIAAMWHDGTATRLLHRWFGKSGFKVPSSLPKPVGCS
ncbi:glutamate ABC transporter substrate-binding protein [Nonomuraea sp. NPDC004186]|uniref:glutamate ABC transporter substrate-binding protein n=1 Tax=Nonomuraea sp. NPDC049625 TaxID=3155775 RepID=UPI003417756A